MDTSFDIVLAAMQRSVELAAALRQLDSDLTLAAALEAQAEVLAAKGYWSIPVDHIAKAWHQADRP